MNNEVQHGYLVLADISGYTSYLAGVELDHAHEILTDLLETILDHFKPFLNIAKLEGDAVFAYVPGGQMPRGETLLELVETTYVAFRDRQQAIQRRTTCTCNACRNIPSLDLKFIVHYGEYLLQTVGTIIEPIGSDVNLAHRLMKNKVSEATGWCAYAMYTEKAFVQMGAPLDSAYAQTETYEHLGEAQTRCVNLRDRYDELTKARRVFLSAEEAHRVLEYDYAAPPRVVWEWFNDPRKRGQWMHSEIRPILRVGGRVAFGARNHCVHGKNEVVIEDVLDIKPFEYYTVDHTPQGNPIKLRMTFHFISSPAGGTHLTLTLYCRAKWMPEWAGRLVTSYVIKNNINKLWALDQIDGLIARDTAIKQ
ncbi:MAG: DUF2652 domain-containing protein [Chloroflexi bacterium]|nr:DUF2652 domain-containing protein [Chloroflexota bacterium]